MWSLAIAGWVFVFVGIGTILIVGYEVGSRMEVLGGNENTLGGLFPVVIVGVIWPAIRSTGTRKRIFSILSFVFIFLSFILVGLSGSRGGAITWLITMIVFLFWRQTRTWGIAGLITLLITVLFMPIILSTTVERFYVTATDTFLGGREVLWQAAWLLIRDNPFLGAGIGNAPYALMPYLRGFKSILGAEWASIHNPILAIWADAGLPGLFLYLAVLGSAFYSFLSRYFHHVSNGEFSFTPYYALVASAFLGFLSSWIKSGGGESGHMYFIILALLLIPSSLYKEKLSSTATAALKIQEIQNSSSP
jgi:O-antigen ligase